jgi:hypothetical protein
MLRPIGSLPPNVYWRRRVVVLAVVLLAGLLLAITAHDLGASDGATKASSTTPASTHSSVVAPTTSRPPSTSAAPTTSAAAPTTAAVGPCAITQLKIAAATDKPTYKVGDQPVVAIQVTNVGTTPCSEALGDAQIEFRVYNGAARVWGSHDCKIDPTPDVETLALNSTVAKTVSWSGYSSEANCGVRQRVGDGTYTLYAYLSGAQSTTAQFSITG